MSTVLLALSKLLTGWGNHLALQGMFLTAVHKQKIINYKNDRFTSRFELQAHYDYLFFVFFILNAGTVFKNAI